MLLLCCVWHNHIWCVGNFHNIWLCVFFYSDSFMYLGGFPGSNPPDERVPVRKFIKCTKVRSESTEPQRSTPSIFFWQCPRIGVLNKCSTIFSCMYFGTSCVFERLRTAFKTQLSSWTQRSEHVCAPAWSAYRGCIQVTPVTFDCRDASLMLAPHK